MQPVKQLGARLFIRQHTSAYVNVCYIPEQLLNEHNMQPVEQLGARLFIRQHASAYATVRQHT
jgi:hypothetical protein